MKKKAKQRHQSVVRCPYCGALADLRPAAEIYHDDSRDDLLYVCRKKQPMGPLANGDLRHLRIRAHRAFDRVWQCGVMTRDAAYRWMADYFCIPLHEAHIGQFSEYRCQQLIQKCEDLLWKTGKAS